MAADSKGLVLNIKRPASTTTSLDFVLGQTIVPLPNISLTFQVPAILTEGEYIIGVAPNNNYTSDISKTPGIFGFHFVSNKGVGYIALRNNGAYHPYSNPPVPGQTVYTDPAGNKYYSYSGGATFNLAYNGSTNQLQTYHNGNQLNPINVTNKPPSGFHFVAQLSASSKDAAFSNILMSTSSAVVIQGYAGTLGTQSGGKRRGNKRSHKKTRKVHGRRKH